MKKQRFLTALLGLAISCGISSSLNAQVIKKPAKKKQPAKPAAKAPGKDEVLRARPVKGKINWAELSREHIRRYPKIRAALAK